jgi:predicted RNase H-like nuclease (RuvC/YqgF family)|tara:strand:+ start:1165 stop:1644 length:480 start_codon:yes stop_codon:yes gene_type:complete
MKDNFTPNPSEDRGPQDLTLLIEQHAKEVWALKQELSKASEEITVLRGTKDVVTRLSNELVRMKKRVEEAEKNRPLNTMDEVAYRELQRENEKLKKQAEEAEVHVKELNNSLAIALEVNDSHQRYNGKLQTRLTEVEEDNKKISRQIEDKINLLRKAGL